MKKIILVVTSEGGTNRRFYNSVKDCAKSEGLSAYIVRLLLDRYEFDGRIFKTILIEGERKPYGSGKTVRKQN